MPTNFSRLPGVYRMRGAPERMRLKTAYNYNLLTPWIPCTHNTHRYGHQPGRYLLLSAKVDRTSLRPRFHRYLMPPRPGQRPRCLAQAGVSPLTLLVLGLPVPRLLLLPLLYLNLRQPEPVPVIVLWPNTELVANRPLHAPVRYLKTHQCALLHTVAVRRIIVVGGVGY